jgi:hypothetical protein
MQTDHRPPEEGARLDLYAKQTFVHDGDEVEVGAVA